MTTIAHAHQFAERMLEERMYADTVPCGTARPPLISDLLWMMVNTSSCQEEERESSTDVAFQHRNQYLFCNYLEFNCFKYTAVDSSTLGHNDL